MFAAQRSSPTFAVVSTFTDLLAVLEELRAEGIDPTVVFLEASEEALLNRFKETRRRHPLAPDGRVVDGIRAERGCSSRCENAPTWSSTAVG